MAIYKQVFDGTLGRYTGGTVALREDAEPIFCRARPLPLSMRARVVAELDAMLQAGVVEPVGHSDWAALVIAPKADGKIHICADYKVSLNRALMIDRSFFDEVRTGVTRFRVRESVAKRGMKRNKDGKSVPTSQRQENTQNISQYGLTNQHIALLQGITLAPERRTGILRSLGPLTQAILLLMEDKYYDKLRNVLLLL
ncbi:unnamed protein product [Pieris macdunnoughi]|uniref:Uncharacterized protein n=1 Tax=Pieris macdunnoughi TaxID=345717 RepID=A0A821XJ22_9NEOP|nr:unnamed protein product [Pieris macdunnoughi]